MGATAFWEPICKHTERIGSKMGRRSPPKKTMTLKTGGDVRSRNRLIHSAELMGELASPRSTFTKHACRTFFFNRLRICAGHQLRPHQTLPRQHLILHGRVEAPEGSPKDTCAKKDKKGIHNLGGPQFRSKSLKVGRLGAYLMHILCSKWEKLQTTSPPGSIVHDL